MPVPNALAEFFRTSLMIIGALFPIVNSPQNVPVFLTLTPGFSSASRAVMARKIAINGFALLVVSVLIGTNILAFFGISLPVVQVGGGLVVIATAWKLLNRRDDDENSAPDDHLKRPTPADLALRAFYPLTLPLTVGPGSISVAITVGANRPPGSETAWPVLFGAVFGCAAIAFTIYLSYRFAESIGRALGDTAMKIILRLSSFILLCIGVQILWNGVSALLRPILAAR